MYDINRMERIKQLMTKYGKPKHSRDPSDVDIRPASGMVGQKNIEGYMPDESGKLIRIENDFSTADYVGPGSYDPLMPTLSKNVRISNNSTRSPLINRNVKPGPCDYCHKPDDTKLPHSLIQADPPPLPPPPLGHSLEHQTWIPQPLTNLPVSKYPNTKNNFKTDLITKEFASTIHRELWPQLYNTPSPTAFALQEKPIVYDNEIAETRQFKSREDRFRLNGPFPPPSTAYTIPDLFGKSSTKKIKPPTDVKRPPPEPTPDGATYAPDIINKPDVRHKSPVFLEKKDRFEDNSYKTPPCTKYNISRESYKEAKRVKIRSKVNMPYSEWDQIPQYFNPGVGLYSPDNESRPKSGYISTIGHNPYDSYPDRPLAFKTQHGSFIQKSFNSRHSNLE